MPETREIVVPVSLRFESNVLDQQQLARVAALSAARTALVTKGFAGQGAADPIDLVQLATYIETGENPYEVVVKETVQ